jgi:5-methylcytosine-specific restriction enzyme A
MKNPPNPHHHLYGSRWREARAFFLTMNPLCRMCREQGKATRAMVVDHIKPHKGDLALFWDEANWQALCEPTTTLLSSARKSAGMASDRTRQAGRLIRGHHWNR